MFSGPLILLAFLLALPGLPGLPEKDHRDPGSPTNPTGSIRSWSSCLPSGSSLGSMELPPGRYFQGSEGKTSQKGGFPMIPLTSTSL